MQSPYIKRGLLCQRLVRYKWNTPKSGSIIVYESTSHYDPVTKQSRPKRKYLGIEDPVTGELIPSSGKRGRRKVIENGDVPVEKKTETANYYARIRTYIF